MILMQKVSFPGGREFEQYTVEFTIEENDIPDKLTSDCNLLEKMFLLNTLVSLECLLFQFAKGYFDEQEYRNQKERLVKLLNPKLQGKLRELLTNGNRTIKSNGTV